MESDKGPDTPAIASAYFLAIYLLDTRNEYYLTNGNTNTKSYINTDTINTTLVV
jgi:hypothetical protein